MAWKKALCFAIMLAFSFENAFGGRVGGPPPKPSKGPIAPSTPTTPFPSPPPPPPAPSLSVCGVISYSWRADLAFTACEPSITTSPTWPSQPAKPPSPHHHRLGLTAHEAFITTITFCIGYSSNYVGEPTWPFAGYEGTITTGCAGPRT
ncbi:uncharacterized protein A4U43_C02F11220 [Asparagus officinalis]|uniref:Uncharacterized protein n=1 Tax=Asparagus officinalis TaxID=4686 RepID=A0A5P1FHH0_ASPOF|nr:uncharacterized protein A4U43_C02F11220 [Asparagus officinalis]